MKNLVIFASGRGSNAEKIIDYFKEISGIRVAAIVSNRREAGVLDLALKNGIPSLVLSKKTFAKSQSILEFLRDKDTDLIILAGFLWLIPSYLIKAYPSKIVNIHPSLLPKYGGKGMYGQHVHQAVKSANEKKSGITIHYVNEEFDKGKHIFQASTPLNEGMTVEEIGATVLKLEHKHFAEVIHEIVK